MNIEEQVNSLVKKAADANDPDAAMKFAQAALNAANARAVTVGTQAKK